MSDYKSIVFGKYKYIMLYKYKSIVLRKYKYIMLGTNINNLDSVGYVPICVLYGPLYSVPGSLQMVRVSPNVFPVVHPVKVDPRGRFIGGSQRHIQGRAGGSHAKCSTAIGED